MARMDANTTPHRSCDVAAAEPEKPKKRPALSSIMPTFATTSARMFCPMARLVMLTAAIWLTKRVAAMAGTATAKRVLDTMHTPSTSAARPWERM